jgi:hypothetical protein
MRKTIPEKITTRGKSLFGIIEKNFSDEVGGMVSCFYFAVGTLIVQRLYTYFTAALR